jgi:hypothetical protein
VQVFAEIGGDLEQYILPFHTNKDYKTDILLNARWDKDTLKVRIRKM